MLLCMMLLSSEAYHWSLPQRPTIPVAGHASATIGHAVYTFGGLRPFRDGVCSTLRVFDGEWSEVDSHGPAARMYAAAAATGTGELFVCGGWDPGEKGSGGRFFDDAWLFDPAQCQWRESRAKLPGGPASRHTALSLADGSVLVHTFRTADHVLLYDPAEDAFHVRPTCGPAPHGLSMMAAAYHADTGQAVFVGGTTKARAMSAAVYVLDTQSWTWTRSTTKHGLPSPPPMASCAAAPLATNPTVTRTLIFGGASLPDGGYAAGLRSSSALWKLAVTFDGKHHTWTRCNPEGVSPPARVATCLDWVGPSHLMLHGGWRPELNLTYSVSHFLSVFPDAA